MSRRIMRTAVAILLAFFLFVGSSHSVVQAQAASPFYWEFINVDIDVQENGDMLITETQKYVFSGPGMSYSPSNQIEEQGFYDWNRP